MFTVKTGPHRTRVRRSRSIMSKPQTVLSVAGWRLAFVAHIRGGACVAVETGTAMREQARVRMLSERRSGRTYSRPTEDPQRSGRTRLSFTASSDVVGWGSVWDVIEDDLPPMPQKPPGKGGWDTTTTTTR